MGLRMLQSTRKAANDDYNDSDEDSKRSKMVIALLLIVDWNL